MMKAKMNILEWIRSTGRDPMFVSIEALRLLQELADQLCPSQPAVSEGVLEFINHLESESFNGWSKEEKRGYLTACGSIKGYLSTPTEQPKQELGDNLVEMISRDNKSLKKAGMNLAEAASYVIKEYDGIHRLSLAVANWFKAISNEGGRDEQPNQDEVENPCDDCHSLGSEYCAQVCEQLKCLKCGRNFIPHLMKPLTICDKCADSILL